MTGTLLALTGPSGVGKGSICKRLIQLHKDYHLITSYTTRNPRPEEVEGEDYFFITKNEFEKKISQGFFLEYQKVYDNYYGTPVLNVRQYLAKKETVILEIDTKGSLKIHELFPYAVLVFVFPPTIKELHKRLIERGTENPATFKKRSLAVIQELKRAKLFEYAVINENIDIVVSEIEAIICASQCDMYIKKSHLIQLFNEIADLQALEAKLEAL